MKRFTQIKEEPAILWEDESYLACFKPSNLLVHRTNFDFGVKESLRDHLKDEFGLECSPLHRLDKPTSGVVLFAKNKEAFRHVHQQFATQSVRKEYIAIVRGYVLESGDIDKPLVGSDGGESKDAFTTYAPLASAELNIPVSRYDTSRYSLVSVTPKTGRYHQIRLHFSHLRHPIIGDRKHGDVKHNSMWEREFGVRYMFLHARKLAFMHPDGEERVIEAPFPGMWTEAAELLSWQDHIKSADQKQA